MAKKLVLIEVSTFNASSGIEAPVMEEMGNIAQRFIGAGYDIAGQILVQRGHEPEVKKFTLLVTKDSN